MTGLLGVFVPFQFDLGGPVTFDDALVARLEAVGRCEISPVETRSFNISYLSRHAPIIRMPLPDISIRLVDIDWKVGRRLVIYPWLGTVSLSYYFQPDGSQPQQDQVLHFYDELIELINGDYLPYLDKHRQMTLALRIKTGYVPGAAANELRMGATIDKLREIIAPSIAKPRPTTYHFMNFRLLYVWPVDARDDVDPTLLQALLNLRCTPSPLASARAPDPALDVRAERPLVTDLGTVWSNGWVSVALVASADAIEGETTPTRIFQGTLNLCHAQWFLCHIWISIYLDVIGGQEDRIWSRPMMHDVTTQLHYLERDLSDVANVDLMLRDPFLIQLSQFFADRLKLRQHLEDARSRLDLLATYLRGQLEIEARRAAAKLEMLFAFSAAAAVAALIHPLWPLWPLKTVAVTAVLLSLVVFVLFSPMRRWVESFTLWWAQRPRSRRPRAGDRLGRPLLRWPRQRRPA